MPTEVLKPTQHVSAADPAFDTEFVRRLDLFDSTMIVVGSMIGSGIFLVSAEMARQLGSPGWLLVAWIVTGVLTVAAASQADNSHRGKGPGGTSRKLQPLKIDTEKGDARVGSARRIGRWDIVRWSDGDGGDASEVSNLLRVSGAVRSPAAGPARPV